MVDTNSTDPTLEDLHVDALDRMGKIVNSATEAALSNPTPCDAWDVREVIEHTIGLNYGFAQVLATGAGDLDAYRPRTTERWLDSVAAVKNAATSRPADVRDFRIAPISDDLSFSEHDAVVIHLLDVVVHTWDVSAGLGLPYEPPAAAAAAVLDMAHLISAAPLPSTREQFSSPLEGAADGQPWDVVLKLLGRDPQWLTVNKHRLRACVRSHERATERLRNLPSSPGGHQPRTDHDRND